MSKMRRKLRLSASAIASFKACPARYEGQYIQGIRRIEDTESQRTGTNWHDIQDIATRKPGSVCGPCANLGKPDPNCPLCTGTGFLPDNLMDSVIRVLDKAYSNIPDGVDKETFERERIVLLYSLSGYQWKYSDAPVEVLARELRFSLPLLSPVGRSLPDVQVDGAIDKLVRYNGKPAIMDHKSTGKSIDSDSSYWGHLNLDTQTTLYIDAAQKMQLAGELIPYGIKPDEPLINTILYDVWHKPGISPKKLTQAESKQFVEDGLYMGQKFTVLVGPVTGEIYVNDVLAEVEPGKKEGTFAIKETPEMFGARLLQDIVERTDFYFARKELSKTDDEIQRFRSEILCIYYSIRNMLKIGGFYRDEHSCEATFRCDYTSQCYTGVKLDGNNPPEGFHCIFNKEKINEGDKL